MEWLQVSNNARSTLAVAINGGSTTITVQTSDGALFPSTGPFRVTVWDAAYETPGEDPNQEIIQIESRSGDVLTIDTDPDGRAQEGTVEIGHVIDSNIALLATAGLFEQMQNFIEANASQGDTGVQGSKGDTGSQGVKGDTGTQGVKGDTGTQGIKGDTGSQGVKGDTGTHGDTGTQGDTGIAGGQTLWRGSWATSTAYSIDDAVSNNGSSYICTSAHTSGASTEPGVGVNWTTVWALMAAKGDTGVAGAAGAKGDTGTTGAKGDTGSTGAKGDTGTAGAKGDTGTAGSNGAKGDTGSTGAKGDTGVSTVSAMDQQILINGGFDVWQRSTSFTASDDQFGAADRWNLLVEANNSWTFVQDTDVPTGGKSVYSMKISNLTQNNQFAIVNIIESRDAKRYAGRSVSLSFWAKTNSTEIANLRATVLSWNSTADSVTSDVIGTWASDGTDPTWATNWTAEIAGSNKALTSSWQEFKVENIAIDTSGMTNMAVVIWVDDGTITVGDNVYITQVQLNAGATALSFQPQKYADELLRCQRYCVRIGDDGDVTGETGVNVAMGYAAATTVAQVQTFLPVRMRRLPTLSATAGDWQLTDGNSGIDVTGISINSSKNSTIAPIIRATTTGLTQFRPYSLQADNPTRNLIFDAEL